jgi:hypothetical protein
MAAMAAGIGGIASPVCVQKARGTFFNFEGQSGVAFDRFLRVIFHGGVFTTLLITIVYMFY